MVRSHRLAGVSVIECVCYETLQKNISIESIIFRPVLAPLPHVLNNFPRFWPTTNGRWRRFPTETYRIGHNPFTGVFGDTNRGIRLTGKTENAKSAAEGVAGKIGSRRRAAGPERDGYSGGGGRDIYARFYCAAAVRPPPNILLWINRNAIIIIVIIHTYAYNGYVRVRVYRVYFVRNADFLFFFFI